MGEVVVKVILTNAGDDTLVRRGLMKKEDIRTYLADAIVDTGAVSTIIPIHVVEKLGLGIRKHTVAEYADGRKDTVGVTESLIIDILGRDTSDEAMVLGDNVLIGQTVLEKLDLLVDYANRRVLPNPAHPDQPVLHVR
jgi:clan AA aspartic protease